MNQLVRNLENSFRRLCMKSKKEAFPWSFLMIKREYIGDNKL